MTTETQEQGRLHRAARALKAYFEQKLKVAMELLAEAPDTLGAGDVRFSYNMSQHGLWGLRATEPLEDSHQTEIYQTFQSILGGVDHMEQRLTDSARLEGKLAETLEELPSNVIPLRRVGTAYVPARRNDRRWILKLDCLIESKYVSEIHKMAMELHSHSGRYAFVEYRDLNPSQRKNVSELLSMGAISLFIPDILELTPEEQKTLLALMSVETVQRPLLMAGATIPYPELRCVAGVDLEFLARLARAYIKLSRPFREYKEQGLIHYFLDSMSENQS
jgi:hypothetical protein